MKTVEEIKASLNACSYPDYRCDECACRKKEDCGSMLTADALAYIKQLEAENTKLKAEADKIVYCKDCKYAHLTYDGKCKYCDYWDSEYDSSTQLYLNRDAYCSNGKRK